MKKLLGILLVIMVGCGSNVREVVGPRGESRFELRCLNGLEACKEQASALCSHSYKTVTTTVVSTNTGSEVVWLEVECKSH